MEGVSLTYGPSGSRTHIWTFANGISEVYDECYINQYFPCVSAEQFSPPCFIIVGADNFRDSLKVLSCPSIFSDIFLGDLVGQLESSQGVKI